MLFMGRFGCVFLVMYTNTHTHTHTQMDIHAMLTSLSYTYTLKLLCPKQLNIFLNSMIVCTHLHVSPLELRQEIELSVGGNQHTAFTDN